MLGSNGSSEQMGQTWRPECLSGHLKRAGTMAGQYEEVAARAEQDLRTEISAPTRGERGGSGKKVASKLIYHSERDAKKIDRNCGFSG